MKKKAKNTNYFIIFLTSFIPCFIIILFLKLLKYLKEILIKDAYYYIALSFSSILVILLLLLSLYVIYHIVNSNKTYKKRFKYLIILLIFNIFYIPIYIFSNIIKLKKESYPMIIMLFIILSFYILIPLKDDKSKDIKPIIYNSIISKNNLFTISLTDNYACSNDSGEYVISCNSDFDDSYIGIYSYEYQKHNKNELDDIYQFHLNQTISYIMEAGYLYYIEVIDNINHIYYDNNKMEVLIKYIDYDVNNDNKYDYRLIVVNEFLKKNTYLKDDFRGIINSIKFN